MENEKDLIQRAIAGDQMAYRELYQIHDMLRREGKTEEARQLERSIVALQSAFTLEPEQEVP